jgi:hypothetical protein
MRKLLFAAMLIPVGAWAHPGHGDTAHYFLGGTHTVSGAHELIANPYFAAALLLASAGVLCTGALRARTRARSLKHPRPRD